MNYEKTMEKQTPFNLFCLHTTYDTSFYKVIECATTYALATLNTPVHCLKLITLIIVYIYHITVIYLLC